MTSEIATPGMSTARLAGLELGGTKCIAVLADEGRIVERVSVPTTTPDEALGRLADTLDGWRRAAPFEALGIASFGPVGLDPTRADFGCITTTPKPGWAHFPVRPFLAGRFAVPIDFDTDVTAAAIAEHRWGAARRMRSSVYLTIGTGLGGGAVVEGRPVRGLLHPEMGHVRVRRDAGDSFPGLCPFHGDCLEGLISGPALAARTGRDGATIAPDDPIWMRVGGELAELLMALVLLLSPQRIAIGGGVGLGQPHLLPMVRSALKERLAGYLPAIDDALLAELVAPACFGADAGLMGALALAGQALENARSG